MAENEERDPQGTEDDTRDQDSRPNAAASAEELRNYAIAYEVAATEGLASLAELNLPLSTGNLKEFPRPAPELRAAEQGLEYLRQSAEQVSAMLFALAAAREQDLEISPVLLASVQPFIVALREDK